MKSVPIEDFRKALKPLMDLMEEDMTSEQFKTIYYTLFKSDNELDFVFIIDKYCLFYDYNIKKVEKRILINTFKKHGLTHLDLNRAFEMRISRVLSKARVFPTPGELLALVKPDAIINIYDALEREKGSQLEDGSFEENNIKNEFKKILSKL